MTRIDIETLLTIIFVLIDAWYQEKGEHLLAGKTGHKPEFGDSEMMILMVVEDYVPYPAETPYLGYIRANHGGLFPKPLDQSAKGIVYGRNVIHHDDPAGMTQALMAIVHDDETPKDAMNYIGAS